MASGTLHTKGPANVDVLLTTTREAILKTKEFLQDQIFTSIPLLHWLNLKAKVTKQGGAAILVPLLYGKNGTFKAYSGSDTLDTTGQEGLTMAQYQWRNMGGTITITGDESRMNEGEKLMDVAKAKVQQGMMSARDALAIDLLASSVGSKNVNSLPVLVANSGTVADVNSSTNTWWQSQQIASGSFAARGLSDMRQLRDDVVRQGASGAPLPDLYLTTQTVKELYEASQLPSYRYEKQEAADAGHHNLMFSGAVVEFDPNIASGELYALNSEALQFVVKRGADWEMGEFKEPVDQDIKSAKVIWMGNLVSLNRRRLGKLTGITA